MERLVITQKSLPLYEIPPGVELYTLFDKSIAPMMLEPDEVLNLALGMRGFYPQGASALSGYVYLGQFLAHDISKLRKGSHDLSQSAAFSSTQLMSSITPKLDLGSVYDDAAVGMSLRDSGSAYMRLGAARVSTNRVVEGYDLPRKQGKAVIADARNDENIIVSQLHLQFLRLHNFFVDQLHNEDPALETESLFKAAKEQVILHFQDVILYDFLYEVLHPQVWKAVVYHKEGILWEPSSSEPAVLPIEYTGAVGRFGHAMVRSSYNLNKNTPVSLKDLFSMTGEGVLSSQGDGMGQIPATHLIDWLLFFDFPSLKSRARRPVEPNRGIRISPGVKIKLENTESLPIKGNSYLAIRNIHRAIQLRIGCAQDMVDFIQDRHAHQLEKHGIKLKKLDAESLGINRAYPPLMHCPRLYEKTPLWYYALAEANQEPHDGKGKLGVLGSLILADSIMGLLKLDSQSVLHVNRRRDLVPATKIIKDVNDEAFLQMSDLILAATPGLPDPTELSKDDNS